MSEPENKELLRVNLNAARFRPTTMVHIEAPDPKGKFQTIGMVQFDLDGKEGPICHLVRRLDLGGESMEKVAGEMTERALRYMSILQSHALAKLKNRPRLEDN